MLRTDKRPQSLHSFPQFKCTISSSSDYRVRVCVFISAVTSLYSDYKQLTA